MSFRSRGRTPEPSRASPLRLSPRPSLIASQSYSALADLRVMTDGPTWRNKGLDYAAIRHSERTRTWRQELGRDEREVMEDGSGVVVCRV